jgi:hypothetical protein
MQNPEHVPNQATNSAKLAVKNVQGIGKHPQKWSCTYYACKLIIAGEIPTKVLKLHGYGSHEPLVRCAPRDMSDS